MFKKHRFVRDAAARGTRAVCITNVRVAAVGTSVQVRDIPENEYLYGFTATELKDAPESIRRVLQARNGSEREILHWRIQKCIEHFGKSPSDTGNTSVQSEWRGVCVYADVCWPECAARWRDVDHVTGALSSHPPPPHSCATVAVDTVKIDNMIEHMKNHGKDKSAIRVMQRLVYHRRSMMRYLKRTDIEEYVRVLKELGLPDAVEAPPKFRIKKLMKK